MQWTDLLKHWIQKDSNADIEKYCFCIYNSCSFVKKIFQTTNAGKIFPKDPKRRKKIYTFSSFILLSILFWLIIKLSQDGEARFKLKIDMENTPADMVIEEMSHKKITVDLRALGARLLYTKLVRRPLLIELDFARLDKIEKNGKYYYITGRQLALYLPTFLYEESEIISVYPDTLFVKIKE